MFQTELKTQLLKKTLGYNANEVIYVKDLITNKFEQ